MSLEQQGRPRHRPTLLDVIALISGIVPALLLSLSFQRDQRHAAFLLFAPFCCVGTLCLWLGVVAPFIHRRLKARSDQNDTRNI
jgi:hypothetical protein